MVSSSASSQRQAMSGEKAPVRGAQGSWVGRVLDLREGVLVHLREQEEVAVDVDLEGLPPEVPRVGLDAVEERGRHLGRQRDRLQGAGEDAAALADLLLVVVVPGRARQGEHALAFLGKDLWLILKMTGVEADQQLRRFCKCVRRNQFCQRFDVRIVRRKMDKTAGVRNQLALGVKPMQFEILVTWHEPLLAEISVIRWDAANVYLL